MSAKNPKTAQMLTLLTAFLGWMFDGMEMGIFPLVARPALQQMQEAAGIIDKAYVSNWMGFITAFFLLGAAAGGGLFGWLGDRVGRVRALTWSILVYSIFTGLSYFAREPWHLAALRSIAALGMGGEWALGVALVMETWPEGRRPLLAGCIGAAANLGYVLIAVITIAWPVTKESWRWVMLVGAAPALLTFVVRLFVPESERWIASSRKQHDHPLRVIFAPNLRKNTFLAIGFASVALIVTWGIVQWIPAWADKMTGGKTPLVKSWAQLWSASGAMVGCMVGPLLGQWIGRRWTYFGLCAASLVSCQLLFNGFHEVNTAFFVMVFVTGCTTASFYGWLPLYLPELFPTHARATGQGVAFNSGRILAAVGAWQMGPLLKFFGDEHARAGSAIAFVYLIGMALIWLAPETRNKPLPE